jgi:cryptochrome
MELDLLNDARANTSGPRRHASAIHAFRRGLRLDDNPALCAALERSDVVFPVFVLDANFTATCSANRYRHLLESLTDLDETLKKHNSRLFVARGNAQSVLPRLAKQWGATYVTFEVDTTPEAMKRDALMTAALKAAGVEVDAFTSHTLYDLEALYTLSGGVVMTTYNSFRKLLDKVS